MSAYDRVYSRTDDREVDVRKVAARRLGQVAERGDEQAIRSVASLLESRDREVRQQAVNSLPDMVNGKGSACAIDAISIRLGNDQKGTRRAAIRGLLKVSDRGDDRAVDHAVKHLESSNDREVRQDAVRTLRLVANPHSDKYVLPVARAWSHLRVK